MMAENMSTLRHQVFLRLCAFLLGVCVGSLVISNIRVTSRIPVNADFCFLARNPDLFESRRFISYAYISSAQPHGLVLDNPSCPDEILSFTERLDRQDLSQELEEKLRNDWMVSVPVLFEGTLYRPSLVRNMFFAARARLGLSGDLNRIITIRAYKAVAEQKWDSTTQTWKPLSP
jgi:hypothetical protein